MLRIVPAEGEAGMLASTLMVRYERVKALCRR